jgi:hypothetical protein
MPARRRPPPSSWLALPEAPGTYDFSSIHACVKQCPYGVDGINGDYCVPTTNAYASQSCLPVAGTLVVVVNSYSDGPDGWGNGSYYNGLVREHVEIELTIPEQPGAWLSGKLSAHDETAIDTVHSSGVHCD